MELSAYKIIENGKNNVFLIEGEYKSWLGGFEIKRIMPKTGRAFVSEIFPFSRSILDNEIDELHVRVTEYGDSSDYDNGILWIKLTNCKIKQCWIPDVVITDPTSRDFIRVYAILSCNIEIM